MTRRLICSGELGDVIYWKEAFAPIEEVCGVLSRLEEIGPREDVDWKRLVGNHTYFNVLKKMRFPPLCLATDLQIWPEFTCEVREPRYDAGPGTSFNKVKVYVDSSDAKQLIARLDAFAQHLRSLDFLQQAELV